MINKHVQILTFLKDLKLPIRINNNKIEIKYDIIYP